MQPTLDPSALTAPGRATTSSGRGVAVLEVGSFRLLDCDRAFELFVGRARVEMRGVRIFDLLRPSDSSSIEALRRSLDLKAGSNLRVAVQRPSGDLVEVELQAREFELERRAAVHTVWRDLSKTELENEAVPHLSPRPNTLLNLVDHLIAATSYEQLAEAVHSTVGVKMGFTRVIVSRLQPDAGEPALLATFPEQKSAGSPSFHDRAVLPGEERSTADREELTPATFTSPESELTVRDSRGEREGIQLRFVADRPVSNLDANRQLATDAANYVTGAYNRLRLETSRDLDESILRALLTKTSGVTGRDFFDTLVCQLAHALGVEYVLATRYASSSKTHLDAVSFWSNGALKKIDNYAIENTPCKTVLDRGELVIESGVQALYPNDDDLVLLAVDAYVGISISDASGETIGHLCALDSQPLKDSERTVEVLQFFATRVVAELHRIDRDAQLEDALASRSALIELLQISLSPDRLDEKLERAVAVLSKAEVGSLSNKCAIYLLEEQGLEIRVGAQRGLGSLAGCQAPDPVRSWFEENPQFEAAERWSEDPPSKRVGWSKAGDICLVPIRSENENYGLLAVQLDRSSTDCEDELDFLRAACSTLAGLLERSRNQVALGVAETRVLRSQRLEAVGQLAGGIAHDFNNLLTAILGNADLLNARIPGLVELASIRRASESAGRLTSQLLAFTRRQVLKTERIDVGLAVADVAHMLERIIPESITLNVNAKPELLFARADAGQLQQVLINLVVNARDAMPTGGLLGISAEEISLEPGGESPHEAVDERDGKYVMITVSDTGVGIAQDSLERIFEPFYTTKQHSSGSRAEGTGLGLSVVYGIVKQHGGYIDVKSVLGRGTEFRVYLSADLTRPSTPVVETFADPSPRGDATVLVVEDEKEVREIAARLLESLGYSVQTASGGPEALARFSDPEFETDVVLLDVVMPVMSGIQTFEKLRKLRPEQEVIFMTGHDPTAGLKDLLSANQAALLHKPFTRSQLGECVSAQVRGAARNRE